MNKSNDSVASPSSKQTEDVCESSMNTSNTDIKPMDDEEKKKMQLILNSKISELETKQEKEKLNQKAKNKIMKEYETIMSSTELSSKEKFKRLYSKINDQVDKETKLKITVDRLDEEVLQLKNENIEKKKELSVSETKTKKLEEICRALQERSDSMFQKLKEESEKETKAFVHNMDVAIADLTSRLEEQSNESNAVNRENITLKEKIVQLGDFSQDMERVFKEQVKIKDSQIEYLRTKLDERILYSKRTEEITNEKLQAAEETKEILTDQINDCKVKFKEYQNTINKNEKFFQEMKKHCSKLDKEKSALILKIEELNKLLESSESKLQCALQESAKAKEEVNELKAKYEHTVETAEHKKIVAQKDSLEKLCRALQSELKELRLVNKENDNYT